MTSKYLLKLLALVREMEDDTGDLDYYGSYLLRILKIVVTAHWFDQIDSLDGYILAWKISLTNGVVDDAARLIEMLEEATKQEIAAADAALEQYRKDPSTAVPLEDAIKEWDKESVDERIKRILEK